MAPTLWQLSYHHIFAKLLLLLTKIHGENLFGMQFMLLFQIFSIILLIRYHWVAAKRIRFR
jgi:hypothetical protein